MFKNSGFDLTKLPCEQLKNVLEQVNSYVLEELHLSNMQLEGTREAQIAYGH